MKKNLFNKFLVLGGAFLLFSCTKENTHNTQGEIKKEEEKKIEKTIFATNPSSFDLESDETTFSFSVETNAQSFKVSSSLNWISASISSDNKKLVNVSVGENTHKENREGRIILEAPDKTTHEVRITQKGKIGFILPFLKFGSTEAEIINFEKKRQHEPSSAQSGDNVSVITIPVFDDIFTEIRYLVTAKGYHRANLTGKKAIISQEEQTLFETFLQKNGFEKRKGKGRLNSIALEETEKDIFVSEEKQVRIEFMNDPRANHYLFSYFPYQNQEISTISALPFFNLKATLEQIQQFESSNNGTKSDEKTQQETQRFSEKDRASKDVHFFNVNDANIIGRRYRLNKTGDKQGLYQTSIYYLEAKWALWQGLDGEYRLTKEFLEFTENQGFTFKSQSSKTKAFLFENTTTKQRLSVLWRKDEIHDWSLRIDLY